MNLKEFICNGVQWMYLPANIRSQLHDNPAEYDHQVILYSLQNQLEYRGNFVQRVVKREKKYYQNLIEFSRQNHFLYPYHLQDKLVPGLRITPFVYYRDMLIDTIRSERSYDCLPNFTAADCLRLLGIGRNQYIETVNTYKSFLTTAGMNKHSDLHEILFEILPDSPVSGINFDSWYVVRVGAVLLEDFENSSSSEKRLIDQIIDSERMGDNLKAPPHCGILLANTDMDTVHSLYRRGLVYIDVPVYETDRFDIPTLEGFVMNRVNGDTRENLLYKTFVSIDSNTTIGELADCLQVDSKLVAQAASIFCRLGFAYKKMQTAPANPPNQPISPDLEKNVSRIVPGLSSNSLPPDCLTTAPVSPNSTVVGHKKLALIFDSTIIAYLMMGNLSPGLKPHAVTMFEVGKLSDDALLAFLNELDDLSSIDEGEAKVYYEHALNLREAIHFLRDQARLDTTDFQDIDLIRGGSLLTLEWDTRIRILRKKYSMVISLSPMTCEDRLASSILWPGHIGPPIPEANSPWFLLYVAYLACQSVQDSPVQPLIPAFNEYILPIILLTRGSRLARLPECIQTTTSFQVTAWEHDAITVPADGLLATANDMTLLSPILIQSMNIFQPSGKQLVERYIPLPLSSDLTSQDNVHNLPKFLANLMHQLDLSALTGHLSVLTLPSFWLDGDVQVDKSVLTDCNNSTSNENDLSNITSVDVDTLPSTSVILSSKEITALVSHGQPIYLIGLHLGLPIFNSELLHAVCERISDRVNGHMLSAANRPHLEAANQRLVSGLTRFIRSACCQSLWPKSSERVRQQPLSSITKTTSSPVMFPLSSAQTSNTHLEAIPNSQVVQMSTLPTRNLIFAQGHLTDFI